MSRRAWLSTLAALASLPAAAETRRRRPAAARSQEAALPTPPPAPPAPPAIDGPPTPSLIPGLDPAPVPRSRLQAPLADRLPRPELSLGLPAPTEMFQGETFGRADPAPDRRPMPGNGSWLPSPGAILRLPF